MARREIRVIVTAGEQARHPERAARELGTRMSRWVIPKKEQPVESDSSEKREEQGRKKP